MPTPQTINLSLCQVAILASIHRSTKNSKELQRELWTLFGMPPVEVAMTITHLEQAKLILGYGLPKEYGILVPGEKVLKTYITQVSDILK